MRKGRKEMYYLMMHSDFFLQLYSVRYMVKDRSDSERGNMLLALHGLLFLISSKGSFICNDHGLCYISCGALAGARNRSVGPPRGAHNE